MEAAPRPRLSGTPGPHLLIVWPGPPFDSAQSPLGATAYTVGSAHRFFGLQRRQYLTAKISSRRARHPRARARPHSSSRESTGNVEPRPNGTRPNGVSESFRPTHPRRREADQIAAAASLPDAAPSPFVAPRSRPRAHRRRPQAGGITKRHSTAGERPDSCAPRCHSPATAKDESERVGARRRPKRSSATTLRRRRRPGRRLGPLPRLSPRTASPHLRLPGAGPPRLTPGEPGVAEHRSRLRRTSSATFNTTDCVWTSSAPSRAGSPAHPPSGPANNEKIQMKKSCGKKPVAERIRSVGSHPNRSGAGSRPPVLLCHHPVGGTNTDGGRSWPKNQRKNDNHESAHAVSAAIEIGGQAARPRTAPHRPASSTAPRPGGRAVHPSSRRRRRSHTNEGMRSFVFGDRVGALYLWEPRPPLRHRPARAKEDTGDKGGLPPIPAGQA